MKTLKVMMFTAITLLIVISEMSQAIAKSGGAGRRSTERNSTRALTQEELARIEKSTCILMYKSHSSETMLEWRSNREAESMKQYEGSGFVIPYVRLKNPALLPKELREFIEAVKARADSPCEEIQFFWKASDSRVAVETLVGNPWLLDERYAYRVRVKKTCGKCRLIDSDLSEYSSAPFISEIWHECPVITFLSVCTLAFCFVAGFVRIRRSSETKIK